jgi:ubiquinol-cytochrome c reductase cytochrome b subunit
VALCAVAALICLAAFGVIRQDMADPVTTSSLPQPDWLFLAFFQVTRYCREGMEMVGVFWLPALLMLGLFLLPFIDRAEGRRKWIRRSFLAAGLVLFVSLSVVTYHTGSTTPLDSCGACHKEGFGEAFATPPRKPAEFSTRYDNNWLALHYRYPQYFWMMDAAVPSW